MKKDERAKEKTKTSHDLLKQYFKFGSRLGLSRILSILEELGSPQESLRVIHIAGTNGKGSVCRYVYEVLRAHGLRVGLFTSPFVMDFYERIEVDGEYISEQELYDCLKKVYAAEQTVYIRTNERPTEFEMLTAAAFLYFCEKNLDFVILEVGLGGAGDTTNAITSPLVSGISSISLDHTDRLGKTVEEIARDKAGIIKHGVPVVSGVRSPSARQVIASRAYCVGAPLHDASSVAVQVQGATALGSCFSTVISGRRYSNIEIAMPGEHQIQNATTALFIIDILRQKKYFSCDSDALRRGMARAKLPGRFEVLRDGGRCIILDGAHNEDGIAQLTKTLQGLGLNEKIGLIIGVLADKDIDTMLDKLDLDLSLVVAVRPNSERALDENILLEKIKSKLVKNNVKIEEEALVAAGSVATAIAIGTEELSGGGVDTLLVAGSLYLIGDARRELIKLGWIK
jgi:dihydrofolate synthase/folylpolyglutamate synthase